MDGGSTAAYIYNAMNQRVQVKVPSATNSLVEYTYDFNGKRITTWNANANQPLQAQVWWGSLPIAYRGADGTTYFEQSDYMGTQRKVTNYAGSVTGTYLSNPFGDGYSASGQDDNRTHYGLTEHDAETATEHAQFRQYATNAGMWMSLDPYRGSYDLTNPQSLNRYAYALNNPMSFTDPLGLDQEACPAGTPDGTICIGVDGNSGDNSGSSGEPWWCMEYGICLSGPTGWGVYYPPPSQPAPSKPKPAQGNVPATSTPSTGVCTGAGALAGASAGALIGEGVGSLVGGGVGTLVAPGVGTIGGGALGGSGGATVGASIGGVLGGIVGNVLCSKGGGSSFGGNQRENRQANDAKNQAERITGKHFTPALERMFHDEVTGMNYSYQELVEVAVEILKAHG